MDFVGVLCFLEPDSRRDLNRHFRCCCFPTTLFHTRNTAMDDVRWQYQMHGRWRTFGVQHSRTITWAQDKGVSEVQ